MLHYANFYFLLYLSRRSVTFIQVLEIVYAFILIINWRNFTATLPMWSGRYILCGHQLHVPSSIDSSSFISHSLCYDRSPRITVRWGHDRKVRTIAVGNTRTPMRSNDSAGSNEGRFTLFLSLQYSTCLVFGRIPDSLFFMACLALRAHVWILFLILNFFSELSANCNLLCISTKINIKCLCQLL